MSGDLLMTRGGVYTAVRQAIRRGDLPALEGSVPCTDCGKPATEYDHRDYAKPLDVEPVCGPCNSKRGPARNFVSARTPRIARGSLRTDFARAVFATFGGPELAIRRLVAHDDLPTHEILKIIIDSTGGTVEAAYRLGLSRQAFTTLMKRPLGEWRTGRVKRLSNASGIPMSVLALIAERGRKMP